MANMKNISLIAAELRRERGETTLDIEALLSTMEDVIAPLEAAIEQLQRDVAQLQDAARPAGVIAGRPPGVAD